MTRLAPRIRTLGLRNVLIGAALLTAVALFALAQPALLAWASGNAGSIGGTIFHDQNGNGVRDAGEPALPGVYVTLSSGDGTWSHDFYSGDDGTYTPAGLGSGDYSVHLQVPKCYRPTRPVAYTGIWIDGSPGTVIRGLDFGLAEDPRCKEPQPKPRRPERPPHAPQYGPQGPSPSYQPQPQRQPQPQHQPQQQPAHQPQGPKYHTVKTGDTLGNIAHYYGVNAYDLAQANGITNLNFIYVGQVLVIPGAGYTPPAPQPAPEPTTYYTVKAGDTLYSIATAHGTTVAALAAANQLANVNYIYVGQQLAIP